MSKILVLGASGSGKSTSLGQIPELDIEGLVPSETFIIACTPKELPFRGWVNNYIPVPQGEPITGNYVSTAIAAEIARYIGYITDNRPDINNIVIDDANYIMQNKFMNNTSTGYKIFTDIGNDMSSIFTQIDRTTKNVIVMMHYEAVDESFSITYKAKTVGKMVDNYLTIEGKFSNVLFCKQAVDLTTKLVKKVFVTNYDGQFPAKTPVGAFPDIYIKNDMGYVLRTLDEYRNG